MNLPRIGPAALGGFVACSVFEELLLGVLPALKNESRKCASFYRSEEGIGNAMQAGMAAMFLAMVVFAVLAVMVPMLYHCGPGVALGARLGGPVVVFSVCSFVVHNDVNLKVGLKPTLQQSAAYFVQWAAGGIVMGLSHWPPAVHGRDR